MVFIRDVLFFGVDVVGPSRRTLLFFSVFVILSQLALGGCVECVMLSVTRAYIARYFR